MCVNKLPSNQFNFIRWHEATGMVLADLASPLTYCTQNITTLPNRITTVWRHYYPVFVKTYEVAFYANITPITTDPETWTLSLYDLEGNETVNNVGTIVADPVADSSPPSYRFYSTFTVGSGVATGTYRLVIHDSESPSNVKYISNCINIQPAANVENYTYLVYRNSSNCFNFNFEQAYLFYNKVFLDLNNVDQQPEIELQQYLSGTDGEMRNFRAQARKVVTMEAFYFDEYAHEAMLALSICDEIEMNWKDYTVKEPYAVSPSRINSLKKGTIAFYDDSVSEVNLAGFET